MSNFEFNGIKITGIQSAVPKSKIRISDLSDKFGADVVTKSIEMTGVKCLRQTKEEQTAGDLGYIAASNLMTSKGLNSEDIDASGFVSLSPDYRRPSTSSVIQSRLKLKSSCATLDVSLGCSGFVYGLQVLSSMMSCSDIKRGILITSETARKVSWPNDRSTALIIGEGAAATLLEKDDNTDTFKGVLNSDGARYKSIVVPAGGFRHMDAPKAPFVGEDGNERTYYHLYMNGTEVFNFTLFDVSKTIKSFIRDNECHIDDYDYVVFHQANAFISKQLMKKFKIPTEKMLMSIEEYGNTSSASIPLTLCHNLANDNSNQSKRVLASGFGVGLSWGVCEFMIRPCDVFPIMESDEYYSDNLVCEV